MMRRLLLPAGFCLGLTLAAQTTPAGPVRPEDTPAQPAAAPAEAAPAGPPVANWIEAQVELHRRGFSCGSIDGLRGAQTAEALKAFQRNEGLSETGELDKATLTLLLLTAPVYTTHTFTAEELARLEPVPDTWLGKSQRPELYYATALELIGEQYHANPKFLRALNPDFNWDDILPGATVKVPAVAPFTSPLKVARIHIRLADHVLEATTEEGQIVLHCPVSIARNVDKRPVGELHVIVVAPNPDYTWDPEVFSESPEAKELGRKLIIPPGPNNPVGLAWIGLDRTGYGMHGTPEPEKVGRTESHGCFRLANWDAVALLALVHIGLPVVVEP
ncbi:L,D-transpeptidase [Opitutus sp. GAS368]|uniref:L,D-transpeptidase family protein n=1 Tax=Opitutus sp. GAS368 TaxID=1882749 RepID=UPI00087A7D28|nr:L,D-transpeptidase [Opitutus sp. GAS368]SDR74175.1 Lipoprotein-anchoring transpeptidase ErfK/SrfK [Opitutus sp. GAS368]